MRRFIKSLREGGFSLMCCFCWQPETGRRLAVMLFGRVVGRVQYLRVLRLSIIAEYVEFVL